MADRYEIKGKVGRGGIGAIYLAYDTLLKRDVAIKRLLPMEETNLNESAENTLTREAEALSRLQHPNVITLFAFEEDQEGPFVVMEYIEGDTIKDTIDNGALSFEDFQVVASQCLDPLITAQDLGLLHRDIKPANIMLQWLSSGSFQVKILDFGLAKFSQTPSLQTLDLTGSFLGSIEYLAPEQLELKPLDARTDMYSLGCVLYYCLAQRAPFEGANPAITTTNHLDHVVSHISEVRDDIPATVADWLMLMISRQPDDRPKDAREALSLFKKALAGEAPRISGDASPAFAIKVQTADVAVVNPPPAASGPVTAPPASVSGPVNTPPPSVSSPVTAPPPSVSSPVTAPPPSVSGPVSTPVPAVSGPVPPPSTVSSPVPAVARAIPVDAPVGATTNRLITGAQTPSPATTSSPGATTKRLITGAQTPTPGATTKRLLTEAQVPASGAATNRLVTGAVDGPQTTVPNIPPSTHTGRISKIPMSPASEQQQAAPPKKRGLANTLKSYSPMAWAVIIMFIIIVGLLAYLIVNRNNGNDRYRYGSSSPSPTEPLPSLTQTTPLPSVPLKFEV